MKFKRVEVRIRMRDGATVIQRRVPAWEVPVLEAVHPETSVVNGDLVGESEDGKPLSVQSEVDRLTASYGYERDTNGTAGGTYFAAAYGAAGAGYQALKRAMQNAVLPDDAEVTPEYSSPELRGDVLAAITDAPANVADLIGA